MNAWKTANAVVRQVACRRTPTTTTELRVRDDVGWWAW